MKRFKKNKTLTAFKINQIIKITILHDLSTFKLIFGLILASQLVYCLYSYYQNLACKLFHIIKMNSNIKIGLIIGLLLLQGLLCQQSQENISEDIYYPAKSSDCVQKCLGSVSCLDYCSIQEENTKKTNLYIGLGIGLTIMLSLTAVVIIFTCIYPCLCCPCHFYQRFKKSYNIISDQNSSSSKYNSQKKQIIQLFNTPREKIQCYFQRNNKIINSKAEIKVIKSQKLKTEVKITGYDENLGSWVGYGFILQKKNGTKFWMYKVYDDKKKADEASKYEHLIYKSTSYNKINGLKGKWYYTHRKSQSEQDKNSHGVWRISLKPNCNQILKSTESIESTQNISNNK